MKLTASRSGFTLIELLVVVAVMAMLMALLGGGIRRSIENGRKRQRATDIQTLQSAIMTYWHDTGVPPVQTKRGQFVYEYGPNKPSDNSVVFRRLINASDVNNPLKKAYLDINQLRTAVNGHIRPMKSPTESVADPFGQFYTVKINLQTKEATVN